MDNDHRQNRWDQTNEEQKRRHGDPENDRNGQRQWDRGSEDSKRKQWDPENNRSDRRQWDPRSEDSKRKQWDPENARSDQIQRDPGSEDTKRRQWDSDPKNQHPNGMQTQRDQEDPNNDNNTKKENGTKNNDKKKNKPKNKNGDKKKKQDGKKKDSIRESQRLPSDPKERRKEVKTRKLGNSLRIAMFILNAAVWLAGLMAIVGGIIVGLSNGTLSIDAEEDEHYDGGEIRWADFIYTTPATLLLYYGILMLVAAMFGCFAAAGGRKGCNIAYAVALVFLLVFDFIFGIIVYWNPFAMQNFIQNMNDSMDSYGTNDGKRIGVIPILATDYWNYLQRVGGCCGLLEYAEWKNKTIGKEDHDFSIPDSCCTYDYDYRTCGWRIWKHYETDVPSHNVAGMVKQVGCITIFPVELTTGYVEVASIAIILGIFILTCLVLCIVILVLIFFRKYRQTRGPQNIPKLITPEDPYELEDTPAKQEDKQSGPRSPATDSGFEEREGTPPQREQSTYKKGRRHTIESNKGENSERRSGYPQSYDPQTFNHQQQHPRDQIFTDQENAGPNIRDTNQHPQGRRQSREHDKRNSKDSIESYKFPDGLRSQVPRHESRTFEIQPHHHIPVANPGLRRNSYNVYMFSQEQDEINQNFRRILEKETGDFVLEEQNSKPTKKRSNLYETIGNVTGTISDSRNSNAQKQLILKPNDKSNTLRQIYVNRIDRISSTNVGWLPSKNGNTLGKPRRIHPIYLSSSESKLILSREKRN